VPSSHGGTPLGGDEELDDGGAGVVVGGREVLGGREVVGAAELEPGGATELEPGGATELEADGAPELDGGPGGPAWPVPPLRQPPRIDPNSASAATNAPVRPVIENLPGCHLHCAARRRRRAGPEVLCVLSGHGCRTLSRASPDRGHG
jgi:hypothetical protein